MKSIGYREDNYFSEREKEERKSITKNIKKQEIFVYHLKIDVSQVNIDFLKCCY